MLVVVSQVFEVTYHGDQYREHALENLQVWPRDSEGAGTAGSHITRNVTPVQNPSASYNIQVVSDRSV